MLSIILYSNALYVLMNRSAKGCVISRYVMFDVVLNILLFKIHCLLPVCIHDFDIPLHSIIPAATSPASLLIIGTTVAYSVKISIHQHPTGNFWSSKSAKKHKSI
jgi:hypothetical protein